AWRSRCGKSPSPGSRASCSPNRPDSRSARSCCAMARSCSACWENRSCARGSARSRRIAAGARTPHRKATRNTREIKNMATPSGATPATPRLWVVGDLNGFFGLFTNVLLNVIVLTGLCLGRVHLPADTVFGRILPALGIALSLGNLFYAYLAWQLSKQEGRSDVTAMPYGPSVPHMFIVVFLIMLPTYRATKDPLVAWRAGLAWCVIIGVIVLIGACIGPRIRALTPRAAMLGTLAGISVAFISMRPAFQMWEVPWIGLVCFALVLIAWTANIRLPGGVPGGLAAVIVGSVIGWIVSLAGWSDYMQPAAV